jgi:histidine triad (HIT) family protein
MSEANSFEGESCVFCKILKGEIPSEKVYEDEWVYAFRDIEPAAPEHILAIPKKHIESAAALTEADAPLVGRLFLALQKIADKLGVSDYRVINNCGENAGQTVFHLHFHLLAGEKFGKLL